MEWKLKTELYQVYRSILGCILVSNGKHDSKRYWDDLGRNDMAVLTRVSVFWVHGGLICFTGLFVECCRRGRTSV